VEQPEQPPEDTRPIAAGETLRRLVGKSLMRDPTIKKACQEFHPPQVGVGVPSACPLLAMGVQQLVDQMVQHGDTRMAFLMLDFKNAFNSTSRQKLLDNLAARCPEAMPWFRTCYSVHTPLHVGSTTILSQTGLQQGDPCGPAGFCWAIQDICEALEDICEWQGWYLDDGILMGTPAQLATALQLVVRMAADRGITLNLPKCLLWGPAFAEGMPATLQEQCLLRQVPVHPWQTGSGIKVLGVPVCFPTDDGFARKVWTQRRSKVQRILAVLKHLPQSHVQYTLLKYCLSACRVNDLMRACRIDDALAECHGLSCDIRQALEAILGNPLTTPQWQQATLAIRCGGAGIQDPEGLRLAARMGGLATFLREGPHTLGILLADDLIPKDTTLVLHRLRTCLGAIPPLPAWEKDPKTIALVEGAHSQQDWWSQKLHLKVQKELSDSAAPKDHVRLECQYKPHAAAWLSVIPSVAKRSLLPTVEFRCALRWHLGVDQCAAPLLQSQTLACPRCPSKMDAPGHHLVCCHNNQITRRHYDQVGVLEAVARKAGFACKKEQKAPDGSRPGDLFISRLDENGPAAVDVTIRDPLAMSHPCPREKIEDWHDEQELDKCRKYGTVCHRKGWKFVPFVMDVWGGLGREALALVQTFIKALVGQKEGWQRRRLEATVWQELSITLAKSVARQLVWSVHGLEEDILPSQHQPY
jgi:hypothetical protein